MDDRISSAAYNPFNDYDISTARGMQRLAEADEAAALANAGGVDFHQRVRLGLMQLGIFVILGIGFTIFS